MHWHSGYCSFSPSLFADQPVLAVYVCDGCRLRPARKVEGWCGNIGRLLTPLCSQSVSSRAKSVCSECVFAAALLAICTMTGEHAYQEVATT